MKRTFSFVHTRPRPLILCILLMALAADPLLSLKALADPQKGVASVYGNGDGHEWTRTANGETVDPTALTAAHRSLPFGTFVRVRNEVNGKGVVVRISDRGPFKSGRIIDLTPAAADTIKMTGLASVEVTAIPFADLPLP